VALPPKVLLAISVPHTHGLHPLATVQCFFGGKKKRKKNVVIDFELNFFFLNFRFLKKNWGKMLSDLWLLAIVLTIHFSTNMSPMNAKSILRCSPFWLHHKIHSKEHYH
jgi:hypothetical protein